MLALAFKITNSSPQLSCFWMKQLFKNNLDCINYNNSPNLSQTTTMIVQQAGPGCVWERGGWACDHPGVTSRPVVILAGGVSRGLQAWAPGRQGPGGPAQALALDCPQEQQWDTHFSSGPHSAMSFLGRMGQGNIRAKWTTGGAGWGTAAQGRAELGGAGQGGPQ